MNSLLVNRVVGNFEYRQALANLDAFTNAATPNELAVAEQIVAQRDEFRVYTNLSRRLEPRANPLSERSDAPNDLAPSLAWVTALARVELAALVAGFSSYDAPFSQVRPTRYDAVAYRELVEDGMRTHYWSLARDAGPRSMRRGSGSSSVHLILQR